MGTIEFYLPPSEPFWKYYCRIPIFYRDKVYNARGQPYFTLPWKWPTENWLDTAFEHGVGQRT